MSPDEITDILRRLADLDKRLTDTCIEVARLAGQQSTVKLLLQYVITPLLVILAGLVGIKLVLPGS